MTQTDMNVANGSGAIVRADINAHLEALVDSSSGATAPTTTFSNMWWFDTSTNILKQRNNGNTVWINTATKTSTTWVPYIGAVLETNDLLFRLDIFGRVSVVIIAWATSGQV